MTNPPTADTSVATDHLSLLITDDRTLFRRAIEQYSHVLRAEWVLLEKRADFSTPDGLELGHNAAQAWSAFTETLHEIEAFIEANHDLQMAADMLLKATPEHNLTAAELTDCSIALSERSKVIKEADADLASLLQDAWVHLQIQATHQEFTVKWTKALFKQA